MAGTRAAWVLVAGLLFVLALCTGHARAQAVCTKKIDICFIVDQSGSIVEGGQVRNWYLVRDFVKDIIKKFEIGFDATRVGLVTFANQGIVRWNLTTYFSEGSLFRAVDAIGPGNGRTNTYIGLNRMRTEVFNSDGDRPNVPNIAIVITDGFSTLNVNRTIPEAELARRQGVQIFAVGVTDKVKEEELRRISSEPQEEKRTYWKSPNFDDLSNLVQSLQTETCREAFNQKCERLDLAFAIDTSSSIFNDPNSWSQLVNFLRQLVDRLNIGTDKVRVGVVNFASQAIIEFELDKYNTRDTLKNQLGQLNILGTATNTHLAIRLLRTELFKINDRATVNNVAILFTDGKSGNTAETVREAELTKKAGIRMLAVGITSDVDVDELRAVASNSLYDAFLVDNFEGLVQILSQIVDTACTAETLPNQCDIADITLILDGSTSIVYETYNNWELVMLGFAEDLVSAFGASENGSHWGTIVFSDSAEIEFRLDDYYNQGEMINELRNVIHPGGHTNIVAALRLLLEMYDATKNSITVTSRGDRPYVKNIVFFVTDGRANEEWEILPDVAKEVREVAQVEMFVIGVTNDTDEAQLRAIASEPKDDHVFLVNEFDDLRRNILTILENACITTTTSTTTTTTTTTTPTPTTTTTTTPTTSTTTTPTTTTTTATTTPTPTTTMTTTPTTTTTTSPTTTTTVTPAKEVTDPTTTTFGPIDCTGRGADLVFIIDGSGSINEINFKKILEFVSGVIWRMDVEGGKVRIGAMTFSDKAQAIFYLDEYTTRGSMVTAIYNTQYLRRTTNTADALSLLRNGMFITSRGDRVDFQNIAIVVTDGESNDKEATLKEAIEAKTSGIRVLTVGIGSWLDVNELQNMASYPYEKNMYRVRGFDALTDLTDTLRDYICTNNNYCSSRPCLNGAQCVNEPNGYRCICRAPFTGMHCGERCRQAADIVIAMDASGSIGKENFRKSLDFLANVIQGFDVNNAAGTRGTRIGFLTFGDGANKQFDLNSYNNKIQILEALSVRYSGGTTNTAAAIRYIRQNMFTPATGDRSGVPDYILLLTDGQADNSKDAWNEAMAAREMGIQILGIAIGRGVNIAELQSLVSAPSEKNVLVRRDFSGLDVTLRTAIYNSLCNNEPICDRSSPCQNGATCTNLMNGYTCDPCPAGFSGVNCDKGCDAKVDVTFVLDSSGSIRIERYPIIKEFLGNITKQLDVHRDRVRVALVYWSDNAAVHFCLNDYSSVQDVINGIRTTPFIGGRTHTAAALGLLKDRVYTPQCGDRDDARNFVLMVTDGNSNIEQAKTLSEAALVREKGVHLMIVAVGKTFSNMVELEGMASLPVRENIYSDVTFADLDDIVTTISDGTCDEINECLSNPCRNGGQCRDAYKRYYCECPAGFAGYNCDQRCPVSLDVVFVLDISGSVEEIYKLTINFTRQVVYGLDMTFDRTRIGAMTYATEYNANGGFYLNAYPANKQGVINALNFYHDGGRTNAQDALRAMRTEHFSVPNGNRIGVQNVAIIVSDGYSNVQASNTIPEAEEAKRSGIRIFSVALGDSPNMSELNQIASDPDSDFVFRLRDTDDLALTVEDILLQLCQ